MRGGEKIEKAEFFRNAFSQPIEACVTKSPKIPSVENALHSKLTIVSTQKGGQSEFCI